ncbi:MAG: IS21 family transposase [Actinomycetota bacterium]
MMTQEEYMNVIALHRQGWTNKQIADALERHPATIAKWIEDGGPPPLREFSGERIIDEQWQGRVEQLLKANSDLLATSIHRIITAEGFTGSYPTVVRHVRAVRGSRREKNPQVSVTIETAPGEEGQADWSDCKDWGRAWDISDQLQCFGAILSWSRHRFWWFADSCNRPHTLEALVRFFEDAGGVPVTMKIDRMGALGRSTARAFRLHPPALEFARYHGFAFRACRSGNARAKGKVERPFLELKDAFLAELEATGPPSSIAELNNKSALWLATHVHPRPHRVTGVPPATRLESEAKLLAPLPRVRFDTSWREPRRVARHVPLVELDGVFYSVPPEFVGWQVEVRCPVATERVEIAAGGQVVAVHRRVPKGSDPVWTPEHRAAAERLALSRDDRSRRRLAAARGPVEQHPWLPQGDYDVEVPDLSRYADRGERS